MKKFLFMMVCAITLCAGFASCSSDDDPDPAVEAKKNEAKKRFDAMFKVDGKLDTRIIQKVPNANYYQVAVLKGETPKKVFKSIVGDEPIDVNRDISGQGYDLNCKSLGISINGKYTSNKEYATMRLNFDGITEIRFFAYDEESGLTPIDDEKIPE